MCHNWNSEVTLYANNSFFGGKWELLNIWLNIGAPEYRQLYMMSYVCFGCTVLESPNF